MDPLTLAAVGAVVGGTLLLQLVTPVLRRNVARGRTRELTRHGLVVVEAPHGTAWTDATPQQQPLTAHIDGGDIIITAQHTWVVTRTRFLWARRHEGARANQVRQAPAFSRTQPGAGYELLGRWREVADECFLGGWPREAIDVIADDPVVDRTIATLLKEPASMAATADDLVFRFPRGPETQEKEVRRALDVTRAVVIALDARAMGLPDLEPGKIEVAETAVSTSGSPFAVRSIDT